MKNIVMISASPKVNEPSVSNKFLEMAAEKINDASFEKEYIDVRQTYTRHTENEAFEKMSKADAMIISFPLYYFCLPGLLISFLDKFYQAYKENDLHKVGVKVYVIVNCGFPEPQINFEAVRVIESFSRHINADFRMGVLIGGGPMMLSPQAMNAPFMKKTVQSLNDAFSSIATDITRKEQIKEKYIQIGTNFPKRMYFFMGGLGWISDAKKNGLKKKELYKRPYQI